MKQINLFTWMVQRLRSWFTLGLEEEFTQYGALAKYNISLARDNLEKLHDCCTISIPLLAFVLVTKCLLEGFYPGNVVPFCLAAAVICGIRGLLRHPPYGMDAVELSYLLTAAFNTVWYTLTMYYDILLQPARPAVLSCLAFTVLTTLFNTHPRDNLIAVSIALGMFCTLDIVTAPLNIALLDLRNALIAICIGVYIDQKNTRTNIHEKIYTSMYKAATKTGVLVGQVDLARARFEVLQCPDYMEEVLTGNTQADVALGQIEALFVAEPFRPQFRQLWDLSTLPDRMAENGQLSFYFQDFRQVWYQLVIVEQDRRAGRTSAVVAIVRDVDEEKRKEFAYQQQLQQAMQEARAANAAKTSFLSRMSHDIRTPLNGIIGLLTIDEKHPDDPALLDCNRRKILVAANHLLSLINDVLQMSKLESGELVLAHEAFDLTDTSAEILDIVSQRAAEAGVTLIYDADHSDRLPYPCVMGSPLHVRQLFLNIYGNCIKYNRPGGTVTTSIRTVSAGNGTVRYRWRIADTGVGMSADFMQHIFDPFSQERADARSVYQGTGLGMSIVKALVDKMDGTITVESQLNKGTVFEVELPFSIADPARLPRTDAAEAPASIRGLHLLLAEDNDLNAEIADTLLTDEGAVVTRAADGQQALELFAASPAGAYDAILMDVMMPRMDGLAATRAIRALDRPDAKHIPILALTANAFDEDARQCLAAGMDVHLAKPLQMERVTAAIARLCRRS